MYKTYILENFEGKLYIGFTSDLETRLNWHNAGKSKFTKNRGPWKVIYTKEFLDKPAALKFEKYLKSLKNKKYLKKLIIL